MPSRWRDARRTLFYSATKMQLEQPVQGSHPGDAGLSVLQYALKTRTPAGPIPPSSTLWCPLDYGLFLGESHRMHPSVCRFILREHLRGSARFTSELRPAKDHCPAGAKGLVICEAGIVFSGVEHDGDIQQSDEEVERIKVIYGELFGRLYTNKNGSARPLALEDFLFIAPYNAQVRALQAALPAAARRRQRGQVSKGSKPQSASFPSVPATANMALAGLPSSSTAIGLTSPSLAPNASRWSSRTRASPARLLVPSTK